MQPAHLEILDYLTTPQLERIHAAATVKMRDGWRCALAIALDTPVLAGADVARAIVHAVGEQPGVAWSYGALRRKAQRFLDWWDAWFMDNPLSTDPAPERLGELRDAVERTLVARRAVAGAQQLLLGTDRPAPPPTVALPAGRA